MIRFDGKKNPARRAEAADRPVHLAISELPGELMEYRKTSTILAVQMQEPFEVDTIEGLHSGKPGDWLAMGVEGELYPIDREVFEKSYELIGQPAYGD